jgi:hypothetical protein
MASILAVIPKLGATLWFQQVVFFLASTLGVSLTRIGAAVSGESQCCSLVMG